MQSILPNVFYIEEKSWNYYPFTITGKIQIKINSQSNFIDFSFLEYCVSFKLKKNLRVYQ